MKLGLIAAALAAVSVAWAAWYYWPRGTTFTFTGNPEASSGDNVEDAMMLIALHEWLNSTEVGIGVG